MRFRRPSRDTTALLVVLALFVLHRLGVILSAGDFLYPMEPSEGKNTQIAWDLMTGRYGSEGYPLRNYVSNTGSVHHAAYSSVALGFWLASRVLGFGVLAVRTVPLLVWAGTVWLWMKLLRDRFGLGTGILGGLALLLVPMIWIGFQLEMQGSHSEAVLPMLGAVVLWLRFCDERHPTARATFLLGLLVGYCAAFNYLLWPVLALMAAATLLPPLPRPSVGALGAGLLGVLLGLWPLWLILATGGLESIVGVSITEDPTTTITHQATGEGVDLESWWASVVYNLPAGWVDYWMHHQTDPTMLGGRYYFEELAYRALYFGPLLLLPWAATERDPARRRLGLLAAVLPPATYGFLAFATPFAPHVPARYSIPLSVFGFSAPALAIGLGLSRWRSGRARWLGPPLVALAAGWLVFLVPWRAVELRNTLGLDRAPLVLQHRYCAYYNLGTGTIWAEMVPEVNDLIDVRSATGDPAAFAGVQAGLWGSGRRHALSLGDWTPPPLLWGALASGLREWGERDSYLDESQKEDGAQVGRNLGWGAGIRARWHLPEVVAAVAKGQGLGEWPRRIPVDSFWEGLGFGWGRANEGDPPLDVLPEDARTAFRRGFEAGRALGAVPKAPRKPVFESIRGPAT